MPIDKARTFLLRTFVYTMSLGNMFAFVHTSAPIYSFWSLLTLVNIVVYGYIYVVHTPVLHKPKCNCYKVPWVPKGQHAGDCHLHDPRTCTREGCKKQENLIVGG